MTLYQLAQALAFLLGSLLGASVLELIGVGMLGYAALFTASALMRVVTLFMLASLEPSGLRLRHHVRVFLSAATGSRPEGVEVDESDD